MRWYSFKHGKGAFTYTKDFNGFNLPGDVIGKVAEVLLRKGYDFCTIHDFIMFSILNTILKQTKDWDFYLIGVCKKGDKVTLKHEIVHGLYYLNFEYQDEVLKLIYSLPKQVRKIMYKALKHAGYGTNVYNDEINAYMVTGLRNEMKYKCVQDQRKAFKKLYKEYF
jgi:transcription antitermination factor NusG